MTLLRTNMFIGNSNYPNQTNVSFQNGVSVEQFDFIMVCTGVKHGNVILSRVPYWYWKNDYLFGVPIYYPCVLGNTYGWACLEMAQGDATRCTTSSSISTGDYIPYIMYIFGYKIIKKE